MTDKKMRTQAEIEAYYLHLAGALRFAKEHNFPHRNIDDKMNLLRWILGNDNVLLMKELR